MQKDNVCIDTFELQKLFIVLDDVVGSIDVGVVVKAVQLVLVWVVR